MKLYHHKTDGGAEYLTDTYIACTDRFTGKKCKEGTMNSKTKYLVRIDGDITKDAELEDVCENHNRTEDLKYCLDKLLDIAEECYPKYSSCDTIAEILDIYKKHFD